MVVPFQEDNRSKKEQVATMFDNISGSYDRMNHLLSLGIDRGWRRKAIDYLKAFKPQQILDVATGTGDFAIEASRIPGSEITGVDISEGMLSAGRVKLNDLGLNHRIRLLTGDSENLPFGDNFFDAVIVAFGVRNFEDLDKGLTDIARVLKPGGHLVILELTQPEKTPWKQLYHFYFHGILPRLGRLFSGDRHAYRYLPASVDAFPSGKAFLNKLSKAGFSQTGWKPLTLGSCALYTGVK